MTANGLCEVCGRVTGFYAPEVNGWYCSQHRKSSVAPPKADVNQPPKKKPWWQK